MRRESDEIRVVMEFIGHEGVKLRTRPIPWSEEYDPMTVKATHRGDEIRLYNEQDEIVETIRADEMTWERDERGMDFTPDGSLIYNDHIYNTPEEDYTGTSGTGIVAEPDTDIAQPFMNRDNAGNWYHPNGSLATDDTPTDCIAFPYPETDYAYPATGDTYIGGSQTEENTCNVEKQELKDQFKGMNMKCICCDDKIHYPDKVVELLGVEGAKKYITFCDKTNTEPQLFCCSCYGIMGRNSHIISAVNKMNDRIKKLMNLEEREHILEKREKELDDQLKNVSKKRFWQK